MMVKLLSKRERNWKKTMKKRGALALTALMLCNVLGAPMKDANAAALTGTASATGSMGSYNCGASLSLNEHSASARSYLSQGSGNLYVSVHYEYINNGVIYYVSGKKTVAAPNYTITKKDKRGNSANKGAKSGHKVSVGGYSWDPNGLQIKGSVFAKNPKSDN